MSETTTTSETDDTGLKAKNAELLGKLKERDKQLSTLSSRLEALEADAEDARDNTKSEVERERSKFTREIEKLKKDITGRDDQIKTLGGELSTLKIDNVITAEIAKAGVLPHHADILTTFLRAGVQMDGAEALKDGVPLAEHLKGFFASDAAKHYIAAPANSGAGAVGSTTSGATSAYSKQSFTLTEYSKLAKEKGEDFANGVARSVGADFAP